MCCATAITAFIAKLYSNYSCKYLPVKYCHFPPRDDVCRCTNTGKIQQYNNNKTESPTVVLKKETGVISYPLNATHTHRPISDVLGRKRVQKQTQKLWSAAFKPTEDSFKLQYWRDKAQAKNYKTILYTFNTQVHLEYTRLILVTINQINFEWVFSATAI